jgi:hypothetical protein
MAYKNMYPRKNVLTTVMDLKNYLYYNFIINNNTHQLYSFKEYRK